MKTRNDTKSFANAAAGMAVVLSGAASAWAVGGNDCPSATVIPGPLPYADGGNTCGFNNSYDEDCPVTSASSDVVYEYTPPVNQCVEVRVCNGVTFDAKLYVYASDAGGCPAPPIGAPTTLDIACSSGGCPPPAGNQPEIPGLALAGGVTYWFVIDGEADQCGNYQFELLPCPCATHADCCDGQFCNGTETCAQGTCQPGTPVDCDDGDACTDDLCDEVGDQCVHVPVPGCCADDADCNDGNDCTADICNIDPGCGTGTCSNPLKQAGSPCGSIQDSVCDHPDTCDAAGACQLSQEPNGTPCSDGNVCTVGETCTNGVCGGGTPNPCDDGNACTTDQCDPEDGACVNIPGPDCCAVPADCDDGNECTDDQCVNGSCTHTPQPGAPCGNPSSTECSMPDTCDAAGHCQPNHVNEGAACDDQDLCTIGETCQGGSCIGTFDPSCASCNQAGDPGDPRNQLSFQGVLKDAQGDPVQGPIALTFRIYNEIGGQEGEDVVVTCPSATCEIGSSGLDGLVSTRIPVDAAVFDGMAGRELGVSIDGGPELTPRIALTSAPQAFRVNCVGNELVDRMTLGGVDASGGLRVVGPGLGNPGMEVEYATIGVVSSPGGLRAPTGSCGQSTLSDAYGNTTVDLKGCESSYTGGGQLVLGYSSVDTLELDGYSTGYASEISMYTTGGTVETVQILASESGSGDGSEISLRNSSGTRTVELDAEANYGSRLRLFQNDGDDGVILDGDYDSDDGGLLRLANGSGDHTVSIRGDVNGGGRIRLKNKNGDTTVYIAGDYNDTTDGRVVTNELQITGGSDLSEQFDIDDHGEKVRPGMVVSLDPQRPGKLAISARAYDRRVAGIISGAGGVKPGLWMGQADSVADGQYPVALSGRVYCWVDASYGSVEVGDLLTPSDTPGHAMKVRDYHSAQGAVIGKAMTSLQSGQNLVLVLVSLQ